MAKAEGLSLNKNRKVLAMFLLGLWVGRHQVFRQFEAYRPLLRRMAGWGLPLGLAAGLLNGYFDLGGAYNQGETAGLVFAGLYALGVGPLALGYAASFGLLWLPLVAAALPLRANGVGLAQPQLRACAAAAAGSYAGLAEVG